MDSASHIPEVVLYSFFPWHNQYPSTAHGLAKALSAFTRVWYVNKPATLKEALKGVRGRDKLFTANIDEAASSENLRIVDLPTTLSINALPDKSAYRFLRKLNEKHVTAALSKLLATHQVTDYIWCNVYHPVQFQTLALSPAPRLQIYYSVDAIDQAAYTGRHGVIAEKKQLEQANFGLSTSTHLAQKLSAQDRNTQAQMHVLPNAMDAALYDPTKQYAEPTDLAQISGPRAIYLGNLDGARIDFAGLEAFAKTRPDISVVLVGPWNAGPVQRAKLEELDNVYLLGAKRPEDCPAYLQHADVGLIPFHCSELTAAIYPLKINEYLAMGLPVLSTPFSTDISTFSDLIGLTDIDNWAQQLTVELARNSATDTQQRMQRGAESTWRHRALQFLALAGFAQDSKICAAC